MPKLPDGSVIVLDNSSFHKNKDMQDDVRKACYILEYLPAYCPDLNLIEHKWTQAKKIRLYYSKHFILKIILILFFVFILSYVILLKLITSSSRDEYMIVTSKPTILAISATGKVRPAEVINVQSTIPGVLIKILKKEGDFARMCRHEI